MKLHLSVALISVLSISPLYSENPEAQLQRICQGGRPCHMKVCFSSYQHFVETRETVLKLLKTHQPLTRFIPSEPGVCFLEWLTLPHGLKLRAQGLDVTPLSLQDITPVYADLLLSIRSAKSKSTEQRLADEVTIQYRNGRLNQGMLLPFNLALPSGAAPSADPLRRLKELGFLGPVLNRSPDQRIDQGKFDIMILSRRLSEEGVLDIERALNQGGVTRIDPFQKIELRNSTTSWVVQSEERDQRPVFTELKYRGEGQVIGLIDDLLDARHCFFFDSGHPPGADHRKLARYTALPSSKGSLHGTFVAGILAGSPSEDPNSPDNGQAPAARLAFDSVWPFAAEGEIDTALYKILEQQRRAGALIFSESWGNNKWRRDYSLWSYEIDRFTYDHEDALVVVAVHNSSKTASPENARNALAVGASRQADLKDYHGIGGRGPTRDGRIKPDILAPGCRIRSAAAGTPCSITKAPAKHDQHDSGATPVHGSDCSTSWAAPVVAGAAALVRQHLGRASGALVKAMLVNSATDMTKVAGKGPSSKCQKFPNYTEGWGRMVLTNVLFKPKDPTEAGPRRKTITIDVRRTDQKALKPARKAMSRNYRLRAQPGLALKVTLAWTDRHPAAVERDRPTVNNLDLRVNRLDCRDISCWYLGNDFNNDGHSEPRQVDAPKHRDELNNIEQVLVKTPRGGEYCVSVVGRQIHVPPQGFALVMNGEIEPLPPTDQCPEWSRVQE